MLDFDFAELEIKGRGAGVNILTKYPVRKIELKSTGVSTLSGLDIWYDETVGRLNRDNRGKLIGNFNSRAARRVAQDGEPVAGSLARQFGLVGLGRRALE